MSTWRLVAALCAAEILGMAGFATWPALFPRFLDAWGLTNTEAGWISGTYFAGYLAGAPLLASATDRHDARRIFLGLTAVGGVSALAFALWADGFASAMILRFLAGVGLAGTYMPGLKLLSDHTSGPRQSRMVAFYTASFSVGASASYLIAGEIEAVAGWRWAFGLSAAGSLAAIAVTLIFIPRARPRPGQVRTAGMLDFRPVLRHRPTMAYVLGYAGHMWELFGMRAWIVAFLAFGEQIQGGLAWWSPTRIAAVVNLIGLPASIGGNELAMRLGRGRTIVAFMAGSSALGLGLGFLAGVPAGWLAAIVVLYGALVMGDSSSLTAGAVESAHAERRGTILAVHSTVGFSAAFLGPLAAGVVLDAASTRNLGWGLAFMVLAAGSAAGAVALLTLGARPNRPVR